MGKMAFTHILFSKSGLSVLLLSFSLIITGCKANIAEVADAISDGGSSSSDAAAANPNAPSSLTYSTNSATYTKSSAITNNTPTSSGGAVVSYSVSPALPAGLSLNTGDGIISGTPTAVTATSNYTVTATNADGSTTKVLSITVIDIAPSSLTYSTNPATYTKNSAIANNSPSNSGGAVVSYSVSPALPAGLSLNTGNGIISGTPTAVTATANYTVTATNTGGSTNVAVSITVNDIVPTSLTYSSNPATYTKNSAITNNTPSSSGGAVVSYSVSPALPTGLSLNTGNGTISGTPTAITATANYTVTATNSGGSTNVAVSITVNDIAPSSLTYSTDPATYTKNSAITNNTPSSSGGAVVSYSVSPGLPAGLSIHATTGVISGTPTSVVSSGIYTVTATNSGGSTTKGVTLTVNDIAPSSLTYSSDPATYTKNSAITNNTPSSSGGAVVSYSVSPALPTGLSLNTGNGIISGTPTAVTATANYTVTATNTGGSTNKAVSITVNDIAPSSLTYSSDPATYTKNSAITNNSPSSSGGAVISYSVSPALPTGLSLNTGNGIISGTPTAVTATANYTVTATNTGGSTNKAVSITVNDVAPSSLTYSSDPATYTKDSAITNNTPSSSGGTVISYSVSPALPTGLSLNTGNGTISGTPTAVTATANYTVTATNTGGSTNKAVSITVNDIAPSSLTYSSDPATYTKNDAIPGNNPSSSGGAVVSYSVSPALPTGLSLNTSSGQIYGTPTAITATANYTVTATNSGGSTNKAVSITINDLAPSSLTYSSDPATYTKNSAITNNTPSNADGAVVSYSVSPALPAGLSLHTTTGVISGTPTAITATANYTVTATNTGGSTNKAVSITVNDVAPSSLTYSSDPATYTKDSAITNNTPSSSGGAVVSYSVSPALPAGLSLDTSTGVISGTPTAITATANYTVTATNTGGSTNKAVSITVNDIPPSNLSYVSSVAAGSVPRNVAFYMVGSSNNLSESGGLPSGSNSTTNSPTSSGGAVVSYSISPSLPAGLSMSTSTGIITGTPTAVNSGFTTYTVTATNSGGSTTKDLSFNVRSCHLYSFAYSATWGTGLTIPDANQLMTVANGNSFTIRFRTEGATNVALAAGGLTVTFALAGDGTSSGTFGAVNDLGDGTYTTVFTATTVGTANTVNVTTNGVPLASSQNGGLLKIRVIADPKDATYANLANNILAWYDPASIGGNDAAVSSWTDSSGRGFTASQATATAQPRIFSNIINGKPVVRFYRGGVAANVGTHTCTHANNAGTHMTANGLATGDATYSISSNVDFTTFSVAKSVNVGDSSSGTNTMFAFLDAGNASVITNGMTGTPHASCTNNLYTNSQYWSVPVPSSSTKTVAALQSFNVHATTMSNAGMKPVNTYFNGGAAAGTLTVVSGTNPNTITQGLIGATRTATANNMGYWDGDIAEIIIYKTVFSTADRQAVQDYLASKYGLTVPH